MEYDSAKTKNEVLLHTTIWMNFQRTKHSEKQLVPKCYSVIPFIVFLRRQNYRKEEQTSDGQGIRKG